jgi:hypothetical protein
MPLTATINLEITEQDYFLVVGPIEPSQHPRVLEVVFDHWDGIPEADTSQIFLGAALTADPTESLANMDSGVSLIIDNPYSGASPAEYPGTTTIFAMWPYIEVGFRGVYTPSIPAFSGAARYIVVAAQFQMWAGSPFPSVTATVKGHPVRAFQAEFTEHSGAANDYRSFGGEEGIAWLPGSKLVMLVGSDGSGLETHSIFPVAAGSSDEDLSALLAGTPLVPAGHADTTFNGVPGKQFTVPAGEVVRLEFPLPTLPPTWSSWPLFRYVNNAGSDIHVSFLVWVEGARPNPRGRVRARTR